mgnify:CR=1 FL=1
MNTDQISRNPTISVIEPKNSHHWLWATGFGCGIRTARARLLMWQNSQDLMWCRQVKEQLDAIDQL